MAGGWKEKDGVSDGGHWREGRRTEEGRRDEGGERDGEKKENEGYEE